MALRDHVEGREAVVVAVLSVVMWCGIGLLFGLPRVMIGIVAALLFLGGVVKSGSSAPDVGSAPGDEGPEEDDKKSIYGSPD